MLNLKTSVKTAADVSRPGISKPFLQNYCRRCAHCIIKLERNCEIPLLYAVLVFVYHRRRDSIRFDLFMGSWLSLGLISGMTSERMGQLQMIKDSSYAHN